MKRRQLIRGGLGFGAMALTSSSLVSFSRSSLNAISHPRREMPIPELLQFDGSPLELTMNAGEWEILPGLRSPSAGFNGPYLGPTLRIRDGQNVPLTYNNRLSESVAVHGHGLHVPGRIDGGPQREIEPESSWALEIPVRQQACTCWYHPHTHGKTATQTYSGLAGMIIIDDENSDALPIPSSYGVDDIPVIVQDRSLDSRGHLLYSVKDAEDGFMGETITVNGIANAKKSVPAGLVRLRLLNGSNARYFRFSFSDERVFHSIATDGGFLNEPVPIKEIVLSPGERSEIVVNFSDGSSAMLMSGRRGLNLLGSTRDRRGRRNDYEPGGLNASFEILEINVDKTLPVHHSLLPKQMNTINRPTVRNNLPSRQFSLFMEGVPGRRDRNSDRRSSAPMVMGINGRTMSMRSINERVRKGQWERWEIQSYDGSHPFHVHGCSFLILSLDGRPVSDEYAGWKDTVRVDDRAEFIVKFNHEATEEFPYMYHCHILKHEDRGMMGQFTVT